MRLLNEFDARTSGWEMAANIAEFMASSGRLATGNAEDTYVSLRYFPVVQRNPFQRLLYSRGWENGFSLFPAPTFEQLVHLPVIGLSVVHLHWLHTLWSAAKSKEDFTNQADAALERIRSLTDRHHVLWTPHNILSHESRFIDEESRFYEQLGSVVHTIHTMARTTAKLCAPLYRMPEDKIIHVAHPSYLGCQPDWMSQAEARFELNIPTDRLTLLMFGGIQTYKGFEDIMACHDDIRAAAADRKIHLLIAGVPIDDSMTFALEDWCKNRDDVTLKAIDVPNDDIQLYFRSADFTLCPYRRTLNSGVAMMSASFGIPVIAPRVGGFGDVFDQDSAILYDTDAPDGMLEGIARAARMGPRADLSSSCLRLAELCRPNAVSDTFFDKLRQRLA